MRVAEQIQIAFVSLVAAAAWIRSLGYRRRLKVAALAAVASSAVLAARFTVHFLSPLHSAAVRDWLPAALFLVPYWQVGQFFKGPNRSLQEKLAAFDRALFEMLLPEHARSRSRTAWSLYVEVAYLMAYPLIPLGLAVLYVAGLRRHADYYWTVVLLATYACFAVTPFVQALPPRMLTSYNEFDILASRIRGLNQWILRHASIGAITFPSAHVAASVAASLVLLRLLPSAGLVLSWLALSIAVAAIVGGYHYAADVLSGLVVAVVVFIGMRLVG